MLDLLTDVRFGIDAAYPHPRAELLKMKRLITPFPPLPAIGQKTLASWLRKECKVVADLVEWTTRASA